MKKFYELLLCPVCKGTHTFEGFMGKDYPSYRFSSCDAFKAKPVQERANCVAEAKGCALCLDWRGKHQAADCKARKNGKRLELCKEKDGNGVCGRRHDQLVHGTNVSYCNSVRCVTLQGGPQSWGRVEPGAPSAADLNAADDQFSLFQYQRMACNNDSVSKVNVFFDGGANVSLLTREFSKEGQATRKASSADSSNYGVEQG